MLAVLAATAFAVYQPDGWIEDRAQIAAAPVSGLDAQAFHPPDDVRNVYVVAQASGPPGSMVVAEASLVDQVAKQFQELGAKVISRTHVELDGHHTDDLVLDAETVRVHIRALFGMYDSSYHVIVGMCRGSGAQLVACDKHLNDLAIPFDRPLETGYIKWRLLEILGGVIALALIGFGIRHVLRKRELAQSPPLVDGEVVTIAGIVRALAPPIVAPLSGRTCVVARSRARVFTTGGHLVAEPLDIDRIPFSVETRHGTVRIDAKQLELALTPTMIVNTATERQRAFLARHGADAELKADFDEIVIVPGARVAIRGLVSIVRDPITSELGYRDDAPTSVRLIEPPEQPLAIERVW